MASIKHYLFQGGKDILLALVISAVVYFLLVLRPWKKYELSRTEKIRWFLSLWYFFTLLLVAFGDRWVGSIAPMSATNFYFLDNWRIALSGGGPEAFGQIVLNFLAFVPLGWLLCWHARAMKKGKRLFLLVPFLSLCIELLQYCTGLGILDVDDFALNTLGGAWGLAMAGLYESVKDKSKRIPLYAGLVALPLLLAALGIGMYAAKPYGFLPEDFRDPSAARISDVNIDAVENKLHSRVSVYRLIGVSSEKADKKADRIFRALGLSVHRVDPYDTLSVYYAEDGSYLWYHYDGSFELYLSGGLMLDETIPMEDAVPALLNEMGYTLPANAVFSREEEIWRFACDFQPFEGHLADGTVSFTLNEGKLKNLNYHLKQLEEYRDMPGITAKELSFRLLAGQYVLRAGSQTETVTLLECRDIELIYEADSKACYRPVYRLYGRMDGEVVVLDTPAF